MQLAQTRDRWLGTVQDRLVRLGVYARVASNEKPDRCLWGTVHALKAVFAPEDVDKLREVMSRDARLDVHLRPVASKAISFDRVARDFEANFHEAMDSLAAVQQGKDADPSAAICAVARLACLLHPPRVSERVIDIVQQMFAHYMETGEEIAAEEAERRLTVN